MKKMPVVICPLCQKSVKKLELHQQISHPEILAQEEAPTEDQDLQPDPVEPVDNTGIVLNFREPVEIYINGTPYIGKTLKVTGMSLASEIVRIAKEAYGWDILI